MNYSFKEISNCNMCSSSKEKHKVLGMRLNKSQGKNPKSKHGISVSVLKCENCGLIFSNPQPIPSSLQDHYGTPPENYWKPEYFIWQENYFKRQIQEAKMLLNSIGKHKALDIGAGLGKAMISLEKEGFDTYGFEPSVPFYERAISKMNISPDKLKLGAIEEVEYPDNEFDFITFGAVVEHLFSPSEAIKKALKWLKPGGIIHIEVPSSNWFNANLINFYYRIIGTNYVTNLSPMHVPYHLYEFDLKSFVLLGENSGFEVTKSRFDVCNIYFVPSLLHGLMRFYMKKTNSGMQLTVYLKKNS